MPKTQLEALKALLKEYSTEYLGLGEMEEIATIDGLIYQIDEHINEL